MNTIMLIRVALSSLRYHKGRTFLTMLGIIVGIASIIGTLSIGYGAEQKMREKILATGNNNIEIWAGRTLSDHTLKSINKPTKRLVMSDIELLQEQCPNIHHITPFLHCRENIYHHGSQIMSQVKGGNESIFPTLGRTLDKGEFFNREQVLRSSRVVVLGARAAQELFKGRNPIGETVIIKKMHLKIIGVLKSISNYLGTQDPNGDIFMPYTTLKRYILKMTGPHIYGILAATRTAEELPALVRDVRKTLRSKHGLEPEEPDDFCMTDQLSMLKAAQASSSVFNLFLFIIASISLIVGGIGVMNIMLVSVTERTKEIGIRMAVGATSGMIRKQFLIEAICICAIGGIIGIIIGIIAPFVAYYSVGFPVVLRLKPIIISFITIFLVGLLFGIYPAHKASQLNPVDALHDQ